MRPGECARVRFVFGMLGFVPVFLCGWLGYVQVAQAGELQRPARAPLRLVASTADAQARRTEVVPQPRGTIADRHGSVLAVDCEAYDVRVRIAVPHTYQKNVPAFLGYLAEVVGDLADALASDPDLADRAAARRCHQDALTRQFAGAFHTDRLVLGATPRQQKLPADQVFVAELRLAGGLDVLSVVEALRSLDHRRGSLTMYFLRSYQRFYPDALLTDGYVGHIDTVFGRDENGKRTLETIGVCGLETFAALDPTDAVARKFLQDGNGRPYFLSTLASVEQPNVVHASLDLELQRRAVRLLADRADEDARTGKALPKWGALVLVEIATGDVLAAASWHRGVKDGKGAAFTPYQSRYEPGSIVKPLVFAHALQAGLLDWNQTYDCDPHSADYRERIASRGRSKPVRDDHPCGVLTPHEILTNSSNIGASYVGLGLDRDQWRDYMRRYGFGVSLGLQLPNGALGGTPRSSFAPSTPVRSFQANSAISFSFGYELEVTALHMARAYLRLFRGDGSELRVCRGVEIGGTWHAAPVSPSGAKFSPDVVEAVRAAMVDVVSSDPHATGSHLHERFLKEEGLDLHGIVGGKTGTAASWVGMPNGSKVEVRNASFIGFLPVEEPRWLAVCVLQKDDSARFSGGSYAAPPAVRLLLSAQQLEQRRLLRQESRTPDGQVRFSQTPGDSGWSRGAPETTSVGR